MRTFLWVVIVFGQVYILLLAALRLDQFEISEFVFKEQFMHRSDQKGKLHRELYKLLPEVRLLRWVKLVIAGVVSVALLVCLTRPVFGALYALVLLLAIVFVARAQFVQNLSHTLFEKILPSILKMTRVLHPLWALIGIPQRQGLVQPASLAEFTDQLRRLPSTVINPLQRQRLESILGSEDKTVKSIMTPKKRVIMVEPSATLGPVVLSDLQKTGHGYFPVATKKGQPEGILALGDIADIQAAKQRSVVHDVMGNQLTWVEEETSLFELIQAFLQDKQYLALVKNQDGEYSGIVTIADVMKHLLGIVKE